MIHVVVLVGVALVLALPTATARTEAADVDAGAESEFVALANQERTARGTASVVVAPDLVELARRHARRMLDRGEIHHNAALKTEAGDDWEELGENVGRGGDVAAVHTAFMDSPTHAGVILRPSYEEIGVGVVRAGDTIWVVEVFRRRAAAPVGSGSAAGPPDATETAPPPAPAVPAEPAQTGATDSAAPALPAVEPALEPAPVPGGAPAGIDRSPHLVALAGLDRPAGPTPLTASAIAHDEPLTAVPGAALLAAALLPLLVGAQGAVVRRLGLA